MAELTWSAWPNYQQALEMNPLEALQRIAVRIPQAHPELTEFPSGAAMLDITIGKERYCAQYLPSHNAYGLSRTADASPFWEGVEEAFTSAEQLEARILEIMDSVK
jgi:hypothetical protein